jgi:hypothetical protein
MYCEWGGGINSKVNFKPMEYILEDIDWVVANFHPHVVQVTDANFGIVARDIDIVKRIAEHKQAGEDIKFFEAYGMAKDNRKWVPQIYEVAIANDLLLQGLKISLQDFDQTALDNIGRPKDDWKATLAEVEPILRKYKKPDNLLRFEFMLGLPGSTLETFYEQYNNTRHFISDRWTWEILPTAPAANPEYMAKHKIRVLKEQRRLLASGKEGVFIVRNDKEYRSRFLVQVPEYTTKTDLVVGSYSYTPSDFAEMYIVNQMMNQYTRSGLFVPLMKYIDRPAEFVKSLWRDFFLGDYLSPLQKKIIQDASAQMDERANSEECTDYPYADLSRTTSFNISMHLFPLFKFIIMINPEQFYDGLTEWAKRFNDPIVDDCVQWMRQSTITLFYNPEEPPVVTTKYNWFEYMQDIEPLQMRVIGQNEYEISQTEFKSQAVPIDWHKYPIQERIARVLLPYCSDPSMSMIFSNWKRNQ